MNVLDSVRTIHVCYSSVLNQPHMVGFPVFIYRRVSVIFRFKVSSHFRKSYSPPLPQCGVWCLWKLWDVHGNLK